MIFLLFDICVCAAIRLIFTLLNICTLNLYYRATSSKICCRYNFYLPNLLFFSEFKGKFFKDLTFIKA